MAVRQFLLFSDFRESRVELSCVQLRRLLQFWHFISTAPQTKCSCLRHVTVWVYATEFVVATSLCSFPSAILKTTDQSDTMSLCCLDISDWYLDMLALALLVTYLSTTVIQNKTHLGVLWIPVYIFIVSRCLYANKLKTTCWIWPMFLVKAHFFLTEHISYHFADDAKQSLRTWRRRHGRPLGVCDWMKVQHLWVV